MLLEKPPFPGTGAEPGRGLGSRGFQGSGEGPGAGIPGRAGEVEGGEVILSAAGKGKGNKTRIVVN